MTNIKSTNVVWQPSHVERGQREKRRGHRGAILWFTGFSGSGKSTLSIEVEERLFAEGCFSYVLDGDNIRHGLNGDLGFSPEDRTENIRRVGEVAKLFCDAGAIVLTAFISPYREDRDAVRRITQPGDFIEVFVDCPLDVCEERDPKGLYAKARAGEIAEFTGISAPYEAPENPEICLRTAELTVEESADRIVEYLRAGGYLHPSEQDERVEVS
jgi:adenylyl-sulfate kinase